MPTIVRSPILVTGSHCSGTTWVGRMLAASPRVAYIQEPFNPARRSGASGPDLPFWYTYVCRRNEERYYDALRTTIALRYPLRQALTDGRRVTFKKAGKRYLKAFKHRVLRYRPLVKDPIAFFSAPWLAERFHMSAVVLIRHPAAFAGSLKVKGWRFPFSHIRDQPELIRHHLGRFEDEIRSFAASERDVVDQAALLWKMIAHVVLSYQKAHTDWIFVRHEDLSRDPLGGFRRLYDHLNLPFGDTETSVIRRHSLPELEPSREQGNDVGVLKRVQRDSGANVLTWKTRLTEAEVHRVKNSVQEYSKHFYTANDWCQNSVSKTQGNLRVRVGENIGEE